MARKKKTEEVRTEPVKEVKPEVQTQCANGLHAIHPTQPQRCQCGAFMQRYFTNEELTMLSVLFATMRAARAKSEQEKANAPIQQNS